ncbi:divalent cation tolerance protein CutA, partial [Comamonas aquatica]|uniref:divalent cation tolerance protein CutA n=1 Tax=Comamonas aquatica TaxID=225991 RepID=UPI0028D389A7
MDCSNPLQPVAVATTTVDSPEAAQRLAQAAVQARLAACVQVERSGPARLNNSALLLSEII